MDTIFGGFSFPMNGFDCNPDSSTSPLVSNQDLENDSRTNHDFAADPYNLQTSPEGSNATLKFISELLMEEEDLERKASMLKDSLALQVAEKSFYDALNTGISEPSSSSFQSNITSVSGSSPDTLLVHDSSCEVQSVANNFWGNTGEDAKETSFLGLPQVVDQDNLGQNSPSGQGRKKIHQRDSGGGGDDDLEEGRRLKYSAVYTDDDPEPIEEFDRVLLIDDDSDDDLSFLHDSAQNLQNQRSVQNQMTEVVDLWSLLTDCAQAVASYDKINANQLLRKIRQHSAPSGDSTQRLAHYFANGLEARLNDTKTPYLSHVNHELSSTDILKAYQLYITACPFFRMSFCFANSMIRKLAQNTTRIHIIDFGILYGFQWPGLIQRLSQRPGGPPKLRITGIDLPQPGFRPEEKVEETKRRLANYCERFNVPSEYNVIAKKWETISYEDLKIESGELVVVNCLHRMRHVYDETVMRSNPRDAVLKLIRRINPVLFIHGVVNGAYNAPFFLTRFREALFHFAGLFDMFDTTVPREDEYRMKFERSIYGRDIANVVACEGRERVDRPETYTQWQARNIKAGFTQIPLDQEICAAVKDTVNTSYHKDFIVEQRDQWMLQGWKGRHFYALSCWKPA